MAVLTAAVINEEKAVGIENMPVAVDIIYKGALVNVNAAGFLAPTAAEAGAVFAGIALETVDNSGGSAGDLSCQVQTEGVFLLTGQATLAQTDVGQPFFGEDDQTISKTQASNEPQIGILQKLVSTTSGWFKLTPFV